MRLELRDLSVPNKLYITKKLLPDTLKKVLGSSLFTIMEMYYVTNSISTNKEDLYGDVEIKGHTLSAYVKLNWAWADQARAQVKSIKGWESIIKRRPSYDLRISICNKQTNATVYSFEHRYTNHNILLEDIDFQTRKLEEEIYAISLKQK